MTIKWGKGKFQNTEHVNITLCIGLVGICVLSIESESDGVFDDINQTGVEDWYQRLPEHDVPTEGIYIITADVSFYENGISYSIVDVSHE